MDMFASINGFARSQDVVGMCAFPAAIPEGFKQVRPAQLQDQAGATLIAVLALALPVGLAHNAASPHETVCSRVIGLSAHCPRSLVCR
jgi:hypothetical protein